MKKEYEITCRWIAFPLHPDTPEEGLRLEELFKGRDLDIDEVMASLKRVAGELGLPFGDRRMTYNSRLAQELGKWAELKGQGDAFHHAVFKAYFAEGSNIGKIPELLRLVQGLGLPEEEAAEVLRERTFSESVDEDWGLSRQTAVTAVPTFILNRQPVVGAQPYEILENLMKENQVLRKTERI